MASLPSRWYAPDYYTADTITVSGGNRYAINTQRYIVGYTSPDGLWHPGVTATDQAALTNAGFIFASPVAPQASTSTEGLALQMVYNVKDAPYGAAGDGISVDYTAIQAAITAAANAGGGVVWFPPGTYVINATLTVSASGVRLRGAGMGTSRILWAPGVQMPATGMYQATDFYGQVGNDVEDITFDLNGQNTPKMTHQTPAIWAGSRARFVRVMGVNRPGTAATGGQDNWYVFCGGHHTTFVDCSFGPDYSPSLVTAGSGMPSGTGSITIPVNSVGGITAFSRAIIDPSVNAWLGAGVSNVGSAQTVTPHVLHENPYPNGGQSTAMRGIIVGLPLIVGDTLTDKVVSAAITTPGTGMTPGTYLGIPCTGGGGTNCLLAVVVNNSGAISTVLVAQPGQGYTSAPTPDLSSIPGSGGSGAVITLTVGSNRETVTVTAVTNTTFTAVYTNAHNQFEPVTYAGVTETADISAIASSPASITVSVNYDHSLGRGSGPYAILTYPWTSDGIGIGILHHEGSRSAHAIKIVNCFFQGLGLDPAGWSTAYDVSFLNNTVIDCISGPVPQDSHGSRVIGNYIDMTNLGKTPVTGINYSGCLVYAIDPYFAVADRDIVVKNNTIIGGTWGVLANPAPSTGVSFEGLTISGNDIRNQLLSAIFATDVTDCLIAHNVIHNPNRGGFANDPWLAANASLASAAVGAITVLGTTANLFASNVLIDGNVITCADTAMVDGITGWGATGFWNNILAKDNVIVGATGLQIKYTAGFPIVDAALVQAAAGAVQAPGTPSASAATAVIEVGDGAFDGTTSGHFAGSSSGTYVGINAASGAAADLIDAQVAGVQKLLVTSAGVVSAAQYFASAYSVALAATAAPTAASNVALVEVGSGGFASGGAPNFTASANGTALGINLASGSSADFANFQVAGVQKLQVTSAGAVVGASSITAGTFFSTSATVAAAFTGAAAATSNNALIELGSGGFASGGAPNFTANAAGTFLGINQTSGGTQDFANFQVAGVQKLQITSAGAIVGASSITAGTFFSTAATVAFVASSAPAATNHNALLELGPGGYSSGGAPNFVGNASGTVLAINTAATPSYDLANFQIAGVAKFTINNAGQLSALTTATATTATAGSQTLPANPSGFISVTLNGTTQKIPYYNS